MARVEEVNNNLIDSGCAKLVIKNNIRTSSTLQGAILNGFGRLFWGMTCDKIGFKSSFTLLTLLQAALNGLYPYMTASKATFSASTSLLYFCLAGNFALIPPGVLKLFGPQHGPTIYGLVYSAFGVAAVGGQFIAKVSQISER